MPQYVYPAVDITLDGGAGGADPTRMWTNPSYAQIDESSADDGDYTSSPEVPTAGEYCEVQLDPASDPGVDTSHIIRYRYRKNLAGGGQMSFTVYLYQGGSMIASSIPDSDVSDAWVTGSFTLETYEAAQITNYADLRLRFVAVQVTS